MLATPGVTFVNLQYGESAEELARAREELGVEIWNPPGINLKDDLDDVAALTCALDLTVGFANATTNIAAACGTETWIISVPGAWTRLGTDHMPWYPTARVFLPEEFAVWEPVMAEVAAAIATSSAPEIQTRRVFFEVSARKAETQFALGCFTFAAKRRRAHGRHPG